MRETLRSGLVLVREVFSGVKGSCSCFDGYEKKKASKRKPFHCALSGKRGSNSRP